jgi:glutaredoxin/glutathione-dependent peroxiredoxin
MAVQMAIQVGEKLPSGTLKVADGNGIRDVTTEQLFGGRKVVLFSVPGAFTPTCSAKHLPGFVQNADAIRAKGIDAIVCLAVNDAFVMGAWGREQQVGDKVIMAADGNGEWTRALGLDLDASRFGMGIRGQRFAMVVEDGVVRKLAIEAPGKFEVSSAEAILQGL